MFVEDVPVFPPDSKATEVGELRQADAFQFLVRAVCIVEAVHELPEPVFGYWVSPVVVGFWRDHIPFLIGSAMSVAEKHPDITPPAALKLLDEQLQNSTEGDFTLDPPGWLSCPLVKNAFVGVLSATRPEFYSCSDPNYTDSSPRNAILAHNYLHLDGCEGE